jgi:hypothetical protein
MKKSFVLNYFKNMSQIFEYTIQNPVNDFEDMSLIKIVL